MSSSSHKITPTPSKNKDVDPDDDSQVVDKILGLLCYRIYVMFRFICCVPWPSKLHTRFSDVNTDVPRSVHSSNVRIIHAGDGLPSQSNVVADLASTVPPITSSKKGILKDKDRTNTDKPIKQEKKKRKFSFLRPKSKKQVAIDRPKKEIVVTYKGISKFQSSNSTFNSDFGDGLNFKHTKRPVQFYKEIFEDV